MEPSSGPHRLMMAAKHAEYNLEHLDVHDNEILHLVDDASDGSIEYRLVHLADSGDSGDAEMLITTTQRNGASDFTGTIQSSSGTGSPQYYVISDANLEGVYLTNSSNGTLQQQQQQQHSLQQQLLLRPAKVQPAYQAPQKRPATTNNSAQPVLIAPKLSTNNTNGATPRLATTTKSSQRAAAAKPAASPSALPAPPCGAKSKKRDERRRVTHNEVERRRRDKINHWIEKLGSIIPADGLLAEDGQPAAAAGTAMLGSSEQQQQAAAYRATAALGADGPASKGGILSKACEYVTALHRKVNTLNECLKESEKINADAQRLRESNAQLAVENRLLRERLARLGISPSSLVVSPVAAASAATNPRPPSSS